MGQQQLLLVTMGLIIVAVAIVVSVSMFQTNAREVNRRAMITDILYYAGKAQRFYHTPTQLAGGGLNFSGFGLSRYDAINSNGTFAVASTQPGDAALQDSSTTKISGATQTIYIIGSGLEIGDNGSTPVKAYVTITSSSMTTQVLN